MTPSAAGRLSETPLAHGLVYARNRRLSGRLELTANEGRAAIHIYNGAIMAVDTQPIGLCSGAFLGAILYELGYIDTGTLDATLLEIAKTKRLHGEVLLERKAITEAQLREALIEQVHRKTHFLFGLPDTTAYAFYDAAPTPNIVGVDPLGPTWRGIRDNPPIKFVEETVRRLGDNKLYLAPGTRLQLPHAEMELVQLLSLRPLSLPELKATSHVPAAHVDRLVYLLVIARCVSGVPSQTAMPGPLPTSMPSGPVRRISSASMRAVSISSSSMRAASMPPPPPGTLAALRTPSDIGLDGVVERARSVDTENLFEVLGVADGASAEAVRAAYLRLSKSWHPDRLAPDFVPVRIEAGKIFAHMTRAHQTLCDAEARAAYLQSQVARPKARPRPMVMRVIEQATNLRDVDTAVRHCQELIDVDADDAEALALQAWATAKWGEGSDDDVKSALAKLERAVNTDRTNANAVYHRGLAHKRLDNVPAAFRDFSRALQLDPKHIGAEREVRIFAMRARKGSGEHKLALRRGR